MKTWSKPPAGNTSTPGGASNLNDLSDVAIVSPVAGQVLKYDGNKFSNSANNIDATQVVSGTLDYARLPQLNFTSGDAIAPFISGYTGISPNRTQNINIYGEFFTPITNISFPGSNITINSLSILSPSKIALNITTAETGDYPIIVSNGSALSSIWPDSISLIKVGDPYWNNVVLFVSGAGANNSTITDGSSSNKAITVLGDTKISTNQGKYFDSSIYFDGTGDMIRFPVHDDFNFPDAFTVECWIHCDKTGDMKTIVQIGTATGLVIRPRWSNPSVGYLYLTGGQLLTINHSLITANTWNHIAFTRDSNYQWRFFINGVLDKEGIKAGTVTGNAGNNFIGGADSGQGSWQGYLSMFRITKGIARYIANFNPETDTFLS